MIPLLLTSLALASGETRRFALVAGANDGGTGRVELRYAQSDARSVAQVLGSLGGVTAADTVILLEPSQAELHAAIGDVRDRVARAEAAGDRTELVVYYSGHSDEDGLLMGGDRYGYLALRADLDAIPADVKLVVLDSCASGAMLREKGGVVRPVFLQDRSVDVTGYAYLTSSSEDEAAQESDRIGGSFFTHYLVSGLRGAADYTNDGRVTLNEAYNFAYSETLARTERTQGGAQHPKQELRVAGSGDLVLTDLSATSASLVLDEDLEGRLYVRDDKGNLVAELFKPANRAVSLGLAAGLYTATLERDGQLLETEFQLREDETVALDLSRFTRIDGEVAVARGGDLQDVPFQVGLVPGLTLPMVQGPHVLHTAISMGINGSEGLQGAGIALVGNVTYGDARGTQISTGFNAANGLMKGAQITAGLNVADDLNGTQISSGLNIARRVKGAQIGIVNIAGEVDGAQIGILNIADDNRGTALGILTINRTGYNHLWFYGSDTEPVGVGVTYGGQKMYTLVQFGFEPAPQQPMFAAMMGLGGHVKLGPAFLDADLAAGTVQEFEDGEGALLVRARVIGGIGIKHLSVFAGPTFTLSPVSWGDPVSPTFLPVGSIQGYPAWFGATLGVRI